MSNIVTEQGQYKESTEVKIETMPSESAKMKTLKLRKSEYDDVVKFFNKNLRMEDEKNIGNYDLIKNRAFYYLILAVNKVSRGPKKIPDLKVFLPEEENEVNEIKIIDGSDSGYFLTLDLDKEFDASLGLLDDNVDLKLGFQVFGNSERRYLNLYPKMLATMHGYDINDQGPRKEIEKTMQFVKNLNIYVQVEESTEKWLDSDNPNETQEYLQRRLSPFLENIDFVAFLDEKILSTDLNSPILDNNGKEFDKRRVIQSLFSDKEYVNELHDVVTGGVFSVIKDRLLGKKRKAELRMVDNQDYVIEIKDHNDNVVLESEPKMLGLGSLILRDEYPLSEKKN